MFEVTPSNSMNAFNWKNQPSETAQALKPSPMSRKPKKNPTPIYGLSHKADEILRERFGGAYSKAKQGDEK
jgi:hypothetical protein